VRIELIEKWSYGVLRESHERLLIVYHLTDYDEAYEAFRKFLWARYSDILLDNSIEF